MLKVFGKHTLHITVSTIILSRLLVEVPTKKTEKYSSADPRMIRKLRFGLPNFTALLKIELHNKTIHMYTTYTGLYFLFLNMILNTKATTAKTSPMVPSK